MHPSLRSKRSQWNCYANVGARAQEMEDKLARKRVLHRLLAPSRTLSVLKPLQNKQCQRKS